MGILFLAIGLYLFLFAGSTGLATVKTCFQADNCIDGECPGEDILQCINGYCNHTTGTCECSPCWTGETCELPSNQHRPVFQKSHIDVLFNVNLNTHVTTVRATDADEVTCDSPADEQDCPCGTVVYSIEEGNVDSIFHIDPKYGTIRLDTRYEGLLFTDGDTHQSVVVAKNPLPLSGGGTDAAGWGAMDTCTIQVRLLVDKEDDTSGDEGRFDAEQSVSRIRHRRETSGIPSEITLTLEKLEPFSTKDEVLIAESVPFQLTISLPSGTTNMSLELTAPIGSGTVFTLCNPRIGNFGSNVQGNTTDNGPTVLSEHGDGKYGRVLFEDLTLTNTGDDSSLESSSQVQVLFDAILQYNEDTVYGSEEYHISAGLLYDNAEFQYILVGQVGLTAVDDRSSWPSQAADVTITGPTSLGIGSPADYVIDITLMNYGMDVYVEVLAANFTGDPVMSIDAFEFSGAGTAFSGNCISWPTTASYTIDDGSSTRQGASLATGRIVNTAFRGGNSNPLDNTVTTRASIQFRYSDEILDNTQYWFGVVVHIDGEVATSEQFPVTAIIEYPKMSSDPVVQFYPTHGIQVVIGSPFDFIFEIEIPEETSSSLVVDFQLPLAASGEPAMSFCSAKMFYRGGNMPRVAEVQPQYHPIDGLSSTRAVFDFGDITNFGINHVMDENKLKIYLSGELLADVPGTSDEAQLDVVDGVRYQRTDNDYLMSITSSITAVDWLPTEDTEPSPEDLPEPMFEVVPRHGTTFGVGDKQAFEVRMTSPAMRTTLVVNITMPQIENQESLVIRSTALEHVGDNFACGPVYGKVFPPLYVVRAGQVYVTSALIDFGVVINNGSSHADQCRSATPEEDDTVAVLVVQLVDHSSNLNGREIAQLNEPGLYDQPVTILHSHTLSQGLSHSDQYRSATPEDDEIMFVLVVQLVDHPSIVDGQQIDLDVQFDYSYGRQVVNSTTMEVSKTGMERPELDVTVVMDDNKILYPGDTRSGTFIVRHSISSAAYAHDVTVRFSVLPYVDVDGAPQELDFCLEVTEEGVMFRFEKVDFSVSNHILVSFNVSLVTSLSKLDDLLVIDTAIPIDIIYYKTSGVDESGSPILGNHYTSTVEVLNVTSATAPLSEMKWTVPAFACIASNNDEIVGSVETIEDCQQLCESEAGFMCLSYEYVTGYRKCHLSTVRSDTVAPPSAFQQPCSVYATLLLYSERRVEGKRGFRTSVVISELLSDYERGYIYESANEILFVCMRKSSSCQCYDGPWNSGKSAPVFIGSPSRCSYTDNFGNSWKEIDNRISTINYIERDEQRLYGVSVWGGFMSSGDSGQTWHSVDDGTLEALLADRDRNITQVSTVSSDHPDDRPELDLEVTASEYLDTTDCGVYCSNPPKSSCFNRFGINVIDDSSVVVSASSKAFQDQPDKSNHGPERASLFEVDQPGVGVACWAPHYLNTEQWIQVNFGYPRHVTGLLLQGRGDCCDQWVTSFRVLYSIDGETFKNTQTFSGTTDRDTVQPRYFGRPIFARYFRINPLSWHNWASLRFDLIGCRDWV